jgi:hypothetical protein
VQFLLWLPRSLGPNAALPGYFLSHFLKFDIKSPIDAIAAARNIFD